MAFLDTPLSVMLDKKLEYSSQRTTVLAQNIANADTPGFKAKDVKAPDFKKILDSHQRLSMTITNKSHLTGGASLSAEMFSVIARETSYEANPNGNNVVLEEEMQNMATNASDYQLTLNLHEKMDKMFKTAIGKNSGS